MEIFSFVSVKSVKKKNMCSMDETDGSLENHKYPAKFPTHLKLTSSVLGQRYTFCIEYRHYDEVCSLFHLK